MTLAVAGATTTASARSAIATCSTASPLCGSKRSERTGRPDSVRQVRSPTKRSACAVRTTVTAAPSRVSSRSRYTALNAAMLPVTPRISSLPRSATGSALGGVVVLETVAHFGVGDLLQGDAGGLLVPAFQLRLRPAVELPRPLGREHDEQVAVGDLVEGALEGRERHQLGTSTSGN